MTGDQIKKAKALGRCKDVYKHDSHRIQTLAHMAKHNSEYPLTEKQSIMLDLMVYRNRHQLDDWSMVPRPEDIAGLKKKRAELIRQETSSLIAAAGVGYE